MIGVEKKRYFSWKWFVVLIVLALLVWGIWAFFFSYDECETWDCFNAHLERCDKVKFIGGYNMIFEYVIEGSSGDECEVGVELLVGELNNQDSLKLEGHKMTCMLPEGVLTIPESNIGRCSGLLKEGLQDLIIRDLHATILKNIGRINLEVLDVPEVN